MASVFIDIPGVGNVEAKNAATESTLRELVNIMKGVQQNTKNKSGPGGPGGSADDAKGPAQKLTSMAGRAGDSLGKFYKSVTPAIGAVAGFTDGLVNTIQAFANVGDSVERAAGVFSGIPIVGTIFTAVAGAAQKVTDSYVAVAKSGASFGGSISNFAASASSAGMTMDKYGALIARNGEGMLGFASTTEEGAKRFGQVSKALRNTSGDLYALGFSTEDINQGLASYGDLLKKQGLQGTKSNAELAAGAKNYMKELDALAKISGEERSVKEAQMKALATDVQFQMSMAGKSEETRTSFMKLIGGFGPTLGGFVKDFVANGTATSEANAKIAAALGGPTMDELTKLRAKLNSNQELSVNEQDRLREIIKKAADAGAKDLGGSIAASGGAFDDIGKALIEGSQIQLGAVKKTAEEQRAAALEGSGFNKKMQEAQQMLAGFSNSFQMALANSGMLDLMLKSFQFVAGFVQTFLVPAFQILSTIISGVSSIVTELLYPAFLHIADYISQSVTPIFKAMGEFIDTSVTPIFKSMAPVVDTLSEAFRVVGDYIDKNLSTILDGLGIALGVLTGIYLYQNGLEMVRTGLTIAANVATGLWTMATTAGAAAMALLTSPIFLVIAGITSLWFIFKKLGGDMEILRLGFGMWWEGFKGIFSALKLGFYELLDIIPGLDFSEEIKQTKEDIKKNADTIVDNANAINTRAAENRAKLDEEQTKEQAARHQRVDKKLLDQKESANAQQKAALDAKRNLDDSETNLLLDEAKRQKSAYIKDKPSTSVATAEATKASIVTEAEQKRAAAEAPAKKTEEEKKTEESKKESGKGPAPSTQDSPATLLASLNTKMDQLIKHAAVTQSNTYETYRATNGLSGNLYKSV
jgi:hypothetical protein